MTTIFGYEKSLFMSLVAWMLFQLLESLIGTVVAPSLIFYIESVGGTNKDLGLATSASMLGTTLLMTFFGKWIDSNGNKYQAPLACAYILGIIGSLIYFLASILPSGFWAINAILVGRFIQGLGGAGKGLVMSWVNTAVPLEKQKSIVSFMMVVGILGQTAGPVLNTLVAEIDISIAITSNFSIPLNPLNSIGLLIALGEALFWLMAVIYIKDPPPRKISTLASTDSTESVAEGGLGDVLKGLVHFDIAFPLIQNFLAMFAYSLYMVAESPVAADMLGWTPVEISQLTAVQAVVSAVASAVTLYLAMINTSDFTMLMIGFGFYVVSGVMTCLEWREDATVFAYAAPILLFSFVGTFLGPSSQSKFNMAVFNRPELAGSIGMLQSIFAQAYTLAGVVGPIFVGSYCLRDSIEISISSPHELTPWAWYVPITAMLVVIGLLYEEFVLLKDKPKDVAEHDDVEVTSPDETTKLVADKRSKSTRRSIAEVNQVFSRQYEVDRRMSCEIYINGVGIVNPVDTANDRKLMKELTKSKQEWEHLLALDEEDEVEIEG